MKIHFCDLCNESVPQADIDHGRAVVRKGRIVCRACDRAMSHAETHVQTPVATPPAAAAPPSSGGVWIGLAALVFTALSAAWLNHALKRESERAATLDASLAAWIERSHALEARLDELARTDGERDARVREEVADARADTRAAVAASAAAREQDKLEAARLAAALDALSGSVREQAQANVRNTAELTARIARSEQDQQLSVERLSRLESGIAAPQTDAPAPGEGAPAWTFLLDDLTSSNAGTRWQGVVNLGDTKDPQVVPHVLPMLRDPDVFVRMAAARVLGELRQIGAAPALIDALEDKEPPVREAAYGALRAVTGKDHAFDPLAGDAERERRVKAWREWWKKQQESAPSESSD